MKLQLRLPSRGGLARLIICPLSLITEIRVYPCSSVV